MDNEATHSPLSISHSPFTIRKRPYPHTEWKSKGKARLYGLMHGSVRICSWRSRTRAPSSFTYKIEIFEELFRESKIKKRKMAACAGPVNILQVKKRYGAPFCDKHAGVILPLARRVTRRRLYITWASYERRFACSERLPSGKQAWWRSSSMVSSRRST